MTCALLYSWVIPSRVQSAALDALRYAELLLAPQRLPLSEIRNFVLLQYPQALGTAIHATPLILALHAAVPGARVSAAASGFALEILQGNPGLERLVVSPSPLLDIQGAVRTTRSAKFFESEPYAVLQTLGNERSRLTVMAMLSGAATRVGYSVLPELSSAWLEFDPRLSQIANNLRIVDALGHGNKLLAKLEENTDLLEPRIYPSLEHEQRAQALMRENEIDSSKPIAIFITQTSPTQRKSWRAERFQAVAAWLRRDYGMQIIFAGTSAEAAAIEELRSGLPFHTASVAGKTGILDLAALMSLADIALTLDTGPMHLARAVRLPMVILAPAWSPAVEWLPLNNPRARILKNAELEFAPADYIIDEVSVDEVEHNLRELLSLFPPRMFRWRLPVA